MTTLQGVIILRVSDLRRFFDFDEFMSKKNEFIKIFQNEASRKKDWKPYFVDNSEDALLLKNLCLWLENPALELVNVKLGETTFEIKIGEISHTYPLGRLVPYIKDARQRMINKDVVGLTLLYLLLHANQSDSDVNVIYRKAETKGFIPCYESQVLNPADNMGDIADFSYTVYANMHPDNVIQVVCGRKLKKLAPKECAVGIFCNGQCRKLLENMVNDMNSRMTMRLVASSDKVHGTMLEIRVPQDSSIEVAIKNASMLHLQHSNDNCYYIEDVISFLYEPNCGLAYVDSLGNVVLPSSDRWYFLNQTVNAFKKLYPQEKILALLDENHLISNQRYF